jgi:hypothetical protein
LSDNLTTQKPQLLESREADDPSLETGFREALLHEIDRKTITKVVKVCIIKKDNQCPRLAKNLLSQVL